MINYAYTAQKIVYTTLSAGLTCPVYDVVPQDEDGNHSENMPYVVLGFDNLLPFDTDSWTGAKVNLEIFTWSAYRGLEEVKQIMGQIYNLLHRAELRQSELIPAWDGIVVVDCLNTFATIPQISGSRYVQGISRFQLTLTEEL